jgi:SAM-dependent methyltransferase
VNSDLRDALDDVTTGRPARWTLTDEVLDDAGLRARNASAERILSLPIAEAAPINGSLPPEKMRAVVEALERHLVHGPFQGVGIELGAGLGMFGAVIADRPSVELVISVEACPAFPERVIPSVAEQVLGPSKAERVAPVIGSFDHLELPDDSLDFAVEFGAFHHSYDLARTVAEAARVLRPGGLLVCVDRAHADTLGDDEVDRMLDVTYSDEWLEANGYPVGITMSRRDNGEHEYRMHEWMHAFDTAGLTLQRVLILDDVTDRRLAMKGLAALLPLAVQRRLFTLTKPFSYFPAYLAKTARLGIERVGTVVLVECGAHAFLLQKPD